MALHIDDINNAWTSGKITSLSLTQISQGAMLNEADLMIVSAALAGNSTSLLVHLLVKVEQILGHQVQEMRQTRCLSGVLVWTMQSAGAWSSI